MQQIDILIKNAYIVTLNQDRKLIDNGCVAILDDKILEVGSSKLIEKYVATKTINASGKFVFPGFINTHTHLFQVMLKGLGRDKLLMDWLNSSVRRALRNFDGETCYYAALTGCIEAIRTGTTTILDYMYANSKAGLDDYVLKAFEDVGIRGILGRIYTDLSQLPEEIACSHIDTEELFREEVYRLHAKYKDHSRISLAIGSGIIWDGCDDFYSEMRKIANDLNILLTMHIEETIDDDQYCIPNRGMKTIPFLESRGFLGKDLIAVHCVRMDEQDIALFKKYNVRISHNPVSNMVLASGVAPIPRFLQEGLTVSLATDGAASNDTQDMLETLKITALLQKVHSQNASVMPASTVLEVATLGGAAALNQEDSLGSLEAGKKADLFIYDPLNARSTPVHDPISSLVYSSTQNNISTSIIDGKIVMEDHKILNVDEEKVLYETQRLANQLVQKSGLGNTQWNRKIQNIGI